MQLLAEPEVLPPCGSDGAPGPQPYLVPPDGGTVMLRGGKRLKLVVLSPVARASCDCGKDWADPICVDCPDYAPKK